MKILGIVVLPLLLISGFMTLQIYPVIERGADNYQYNSFLAGVPMFYPGYGTPHMSKLLLYDIHNLSDKNNVIVVGASTTREGLLPNYTTSGEFTIHNFGMAGNNPHNDKLLLHYVDTYGNHKYDKSDFIIFHITPGYFREDSSDASFIAHHLKSIAKCRFADGEISTCLSQNRIYGTFLQHYLKIVSLREIIPSYFYSIIDIDRPHPSMFFAVENRTIDDFVRDWDRRTFSVKSYPCEVTDEFIDLITTMQNQTNVIVLNLYMPPEARSVQKVQEYENWVYSDLVSILKEHDITFLDFSNDILEHNYYMDTGHLNYSGRVLYTKLFDEKIANLGGFANISKTYRV